MQWLIYNYDFFFRPYGVIMDYGVHMCFAFNSHDPVFEMQTKFHKSFKGMCFIYLRLKVLLHMSRVMRKMDFCLGENTGIDQLHSNCEADYCEADQLLCLRYADSTTPLLFIYSQNFKPLACFCSCTGQFVSDLVGNSKDQFSRVTAHIIHYNRSELHILFRTHLSSEF